MTDVAAIRARREAVADRWCTVDPPWGDSSWVIAGSNDPHGGEFVCECMPSADLSISGNEHANAAFIAHAPADIDALLALVTEQAAEIAALKRDLSNAFSLFGQNEIEAYNRLSSAPGTGGDHD